MPEHAHKVVSVLLKVQASRCQEKLVDKLGKVVLTVVV